MCSPTLAAGGALMVVGTAATAYGAYTGAMASNNMAEYQSLVAKNNAERARIQGDYVQERSVEKAAQHRKDVGRFVGEQRAYMGASGVVVDEGSFQDVTEDTIRQGKLDELAILYEGEVTAWQLEMQALGYESQATMAEMSMIDPVQAALPGVMQGIGKGFSLYSRSGEAQ